MNKVPRVSVTAKMERYKLIKEVGNGTFGVVWRALNKHNGEVVAIKKMKRKYYSWEECINLREVKSLRKMNHTNIVELKEVIRENNILYFVFEYMECNLYQLMKGRVNPFSETEIRNWCFHVFQGLVYMHQHGYFNRDLKPDEIYKICSVIGSPTENTWCEGLELASKMNYQFPELPGVDLATLIPSASKEAVSLIDALCSWDPCKRPTAVEAPQHPFFQSCYYIPPSLRPKPTTVKTSPSVGLNGRGALKQNYAMGNSCLLPKVKPAGNVTSSAKVSASLSAGWS